MHVAILTVSDRASAGEYPDETGPALRDLLQEGLPGATFAITAVVSDDQERIRTVVTEWCDSGEIDLVVTNGGTGLAARDVTPEALVTVIQRPIPGLAERMRAAGRTQTPMADLSRQVAGQRGKTLVLAVPGSPKAATESIAAVLPMLAHAVEMIGS